MTEASLGFLALLWSGSILARILPQRWTIAGAAAGGRLAARFAPARAVVADNLAQIERARRAEVPPRSPRHRPLLPGRGAADPRPEDVFSSYGRYWGEFVCAAVRPEPLIRACRAEGIEHLETARALGAVCVLTGHLGNWDLGARWLATQLPRLAVVAEELRPEALTRLCTRLRGKDGLTVFTGAGAGMRLFRHLRQGGNAALVADRVLGSGARAVWVLGGWRALPETGIRLARRAGASLVPAFLLRRDGEYVIRVHSAIGPEEDPVETFARLLEQEILEAPDQWCVLSRLNDAGPPVSQDKGAVAV